MADRFETLDEDTVVARMWEQYTRDRDLGHLQYLEDSELHNRFFCGDQWDQDDIDRLDKEGRPHLTINQVLPTINTVLGEQASNRMVVKLKPQKNADHKQAAMLGKLVQHIIEDQEYSWKESEVFADGLIQDRGFFDVRMDFAHNAQGEVSISVEDPNDIVLDADAKEYDPATWTRVSKTRWLSIDDIEAEYGADAAASVAGYVSANDSFDRDAFSFHNSFGAEAGRTTVQDGDRLRNLKSVRLIEVQHRQYSDKVRYFVTQQGDTLQVPGFMDEETADYYAVEHGYNIITRPGFRIRWTVIAGDRTLIHDEWSPYPWITLVPFFPYFRRGRPFGMVRNIVSPQTQLNKLSSQELHIISSTANSGWIIEEGSLGDGLTLDDVEKNGAKTGFVISFRQGRQAPQKIQPNQIPTGVNQMAAKSQMFIRDISGISAPMQGNASPYTSSRALQDQIQRSQVQIQKPMDNLARTRRMVSEKVLYLIQTYYTEERAFHIGTDLEPGVTDEELIINQELAGEIINDVTLGKYKVIVTQQPSIDNVQDAQRNELLSMREMGVMIPDHLLVKYSNLNDRDDLVEILKRMNGLHEPTPEEQELAEFQRQAQMQSIQLDLQQKQARIQELIAKVDLTNAQTSSELDPDAIKNVLEILHLQMDMQKNIDNLTARMEMSRMAHAAAMQKSAAQHMVTLRGQDMQQETAVLQSQLSQLARTDHSRNGDS